MTKITRISSAASGPVSKAGRTGGAFSATPSSPAGAAPRTDAASPTPMLSALIALQSEDYRGANQGGRKTLAAAQQVLGELERLQYALLDGGHGRGAIESLEKAARLRAHAGADPKLITLYDEIALRARVELAKRGR